MDTLWPVAAALDATRNASAHFDGSVVGPVDRATSSFLGSAGGAAVALLPSAVVVTLAPSAVNSFVDSAIAWCRVLLFFSFWTTSCPSRPRLVSWRFEQIGQPVELG